MIKFLTGCLIGAGCFFILLQSGCLKEENITPVNNSKRIDSTNAPTFVHKLNSLDSSTIKHIDKLNELLTTEKNTTVLRRPDNCRPANLRVQDEPQCGTNCKRIKSNVRSSNSYYIIEYWSDNPNDTNVYTAIVFIPSSIQFNYLFTTGNGFYPCVNYSARIKYTCDNGQLSDWSNTVNFRLITTLCN